MDESSGVVLCLDFPAGLEFGIDTVSWQGASEATCGAGPKFCGVRDIPPGLHLVYVSQAPGGAGLRTGIFLQFGAGDTHVLQWHASTETLNTSTSAHVPNLVERVECGEFGDRLGPFPAAETVHWPLLVQYITPDTLRCAGLSLGAPTVADDDIATGCTPNGQVVPYFPDVARTARYAPVRHRRVEGMTTEQVTLYNLEPDVRLRHAVHNYYGGSALALLGEFQLAFVLFLLLLSMEALEQWKALLHLVASCEQHANNWRELFLGLLVVLPQQLQLADSDFFTDELTGDNFLRSSLGLLARGAMHPGADAVLHDAGASLLSFVRDKFSVALATQPADDDDEDRPVVVVDAYDEGAAAMLPEERRDHAGASAPTDISQEQHQQRMSWMVG